VRGAGRIRLRGFAGAAGEQGDGAQGRQCRAGRPPGQSTPVAASRCATPACPNSLRQRVPRRGGWGYGGTATFDFRRTLAPALRTRRFAPLPAEGEGLRSGMHDVHRPCRVISG
jgi:hypothetical protein